MIEIHNREFPRKVYVILDVNGRVIEQAIADYAHHALKAGREIHGEAAKTAMLKDEYLRLEKETKWLRAAARVEA